MILIPTNIQMICSDSIDIYLNLKSNKFICNACCNSIDYNTHFYDLDNLESILNEYFFKDYTLCNKFKFKHNSCKHKFDTNKNMALNVHCLTQCNFNCPKCVRHYKNDDPSKELEITYRLFDWVNKYNRINKLYLSGNGELSTYKSFDFNKIPNNIKELVAFTNGSNYEFYDNLINFCKKRNIQLSLIASLHSINPKIFDIITGTKDQCKKVINNLIMLNKKVKVVPNIVDFGINNLEETVEFLLLNNFNEIKLGMDAFNPTQKNILSVIKKLNYKRIINCSKSEYTLYF